MCKEQREINRLLKSVMKTSNGYNTDSLISVTKQLSVIFKERELALKRIENAKNCLVCSAISDPMEVCFATLDILERNNADNNLTNRE